MSDWWIGRFVGDANSETAKRLLLDRRAIIFGIFRGAGYFERDAMVSSLPAQIAIFRGPILRECATRGEAVREIRDTVVHEIGHMLGLEDGEMPY